jgi:hypothetical protein
MTNKKMIEEVEAKFKHYYKKLKELQVNSKKSTSRMDGIFTGLGYALDAMGVPEIRQFEIMGEVKDELGVD